MNVVELRLEMAINEAGEFKDVRLSKEDAEKILELLKEKELKEQCLKTKCVICPHCDHCDVDEMGKIKEQEPVLLKNQHQPGGPNSPWISRCPQCGKKIEGRQTRFCKYCGQAVKWDA